MASKTPSDSFAVKDKVGFLKESHPFLIYLLSIGVGVVSALATVGFIKLYQLIRRIIYLSNTPNLNSIFSKMPLWQTLAFFIIGGAFIGLFIYYVVPIKGCGHGMTHFLYSYRKQHNISLQEGLSSATASNLTLALGASVGREAPLMHFGASLASWLCQMFKFKGHYYRLFLAAAVATALATSLHSTFFALFFILEVVAFTLSAYDLIPIALALFSGSIIRELFPEILPPTFWQYLTYDQVDHILYYAILGIILGICAVLFIQSLKWTISWHHKSQLPSWIWPLFGGIALGLIAFYCPQAMGLSFDVIEIATHWSTPPMAFVITFLILKWLATYFSLGFGFSGGVITPSFLLGIFLGIIYSMCLEALFPASSFGYALYALAGSAIFTSAIIGAPLAMTILSFELTHNVPFSLNIFVGIVCARLILRLFNTESCYRTQYELAFGH